MKVRHHMTSYVGHDHNIISLFTGKCNESETWAEWRVVLEVICKIKDYLHKESESVRVRESKIDRSLITKGRKASWGMSWGSGVGRTGSEDDVGTGEAAADKEAVGGICRRAERSVDTTETHCWVIIGYRRGEWVVETYGGELIGRRQSKEMGHSWNIS